MHNTFPTRRIVPIAVALAITLTLVVSVAQVAQRLPESKSVMRVNVAPGSIVAASANVEAWAVDLAAKMRELPIRDGAIDDLTRYCSPQQMRVEWAAPQDTYSYGAHIEPLGPAPGPNTSKVNGIVVCEGSTYAYMGFEALRIGAGWEILPIPDIGGDEDEHGIESPQDQVDPGLVPHATPPAAPVTKPAKGAVASGPMPKPAKALSAAIETYSGYDPQSTCSPSAKPGVLAFRKMALASNPGSRSLGVTRACSAGGRSEHKEGRAFDWGVRVDRPAERAQADRMLAWLFASDKFGNTHAMARRTGIMYIVWNGRIWGAYRAQQGWRPYSGGNAHTDHIHFSFAWPGANGKTSFWTGVPAAMPGGSSGGGNGNGGSLLVDYRPDRDGTTIADGHRRRQRRDGTRPGVSDGTRTGWDWRDHDGDWRDRDRDLNWDWRDPNRPTRDQDHDPTPPSTDGAPPDGSGAGNPPSSDPIANDPANSGSGGNDPPSSGSVQNDPAADNAGRLEAMRIARLTASRGCTVEPCLFEFSAPASTREIPQCSVGSGQRFSAGELPTPSRTNLCWSHQKAARKTQ